MTKLSFPLGLLVLLSCGVVEAGEWHKVVTDSGDTLVTCNELRNEYWTPCELKMREAMKAIAPFLSKTGDITSVEAVYITPSGRLRQEADAMDREDAAAQQFRDVMKECVQ